MSDANSSVEQRLDRIEMILGRILELQKMNDLSIGEAALGTRSTYSAPCSTKSIGTACNIGGSLAAARPAG